MKIKQYLTGKIRFTYTLFLILAICFTTSCDSDDSDASETTGDYEDLTVDNYLMIATGQDVAYDDDGEEINVSEGDDFYGQDAHYLKGETMSYEVCDDETTILDNNTGLMWQKTPSSEGLSWEEAETYCENLTLGGYDDWRMPSCKELFSISDFESGWPYIDTDYFDLAVEVSKDEQYWASDYYAGVTVEGGSDAAFGVNHVTGHIKAYAATVSGQFGNYVRAVRGDDYGVNEYTNNSDSTITDSSTGLMWAQYDSGEGLIWEDALSYAENSTLAGYTDWRLPNIKELQGIIDYSKSPSATDSENIGPAIDTDYFYCSLYTGDDSNYDEDYPYFWSSTSSYFSTSSPGYYYAWYVAFGCAVDDDGDDFHGAGAVRFDTKDIDGPAAEEAERYYNYVRIVRDID
jgi:hypothetical protein